MKEIEINGQVWPLKFGYGALYQYEKNIGRSALIDLAKYGEGEVNISFIAELAHAGFVTGARAAKKVFPFNAADVADWLTAENIAVVIESFIESLPKPDNSTGEPVAAITPQA